MKVKIGKVVFDSSQCPIMLILDDNDKKLISGMDSSTTRFCAFPKQVSREEVEAFMTLPEEDENRVIH